MGPFRCCPTGMIGHVCGGERAARHSGERMRPSRFSPARRSQTGLAANGPEPRRVPQNQEASLFPAMTPPTASLKPIFRM